VQQPNTFNDDVNLRRAAGAVKSNLAPIIAVALLAAAGAFAYSRAQAPEFEATTSILQTGSQLSGSPAIANQTVNAAPLPPLALKEALSSGAVIEDIRARIRNLQGLTVEEKTEVGLALQRDAAEGLETIELRGQPDAFGNGTYDLTAKASSAAAAAGLANTSAEALVAWDRNRALGRLRQTRTAVQEQLAGINRQLATAGPTEARYLLDRRNSLTTRISDLTAQERAAGSVLAILRPAVTPQEPVRPNPVRNALLAALLGAFFSAAYVMLRQAGSRTIDDPSDLRALDLRVLGAIPRVRSGRGGVVLSGLTRGAAAEALARLRLSINSLMGKAKPKVILVTSTTAGEGKTTITGGVANSFSAAGQKVLVIDADMRRPGQSGLWGRVAPNAEWVALPGADPFPTEEARDLRSAVLRPDAAQVKKLRDTLHLLPAGGGERGYTDEQLATAIRTWSVGYDVVLIDSPPAGATADAMVLGGLSDGVLIVVEPGQVTSDSLASVLDSFALADTRVLGVVLNKRIGSNRAYPSLAPVAADR
jgi:Mrp family chromosome partitioning ATPase